MALSTIPVSRITLSSTALTLSVGQTMQLVATVSPADATHKAVNWSCRNESVATVDATGRVTAQAVGAATIVATTLDGNKTATTALTIIAADVQPPTVPANLIAVNITADRVDLSWDAAVDDGGNDEGIVSYEVSAGTTRVGTTTATTYTVLGLAENTYYSFSVTAKDTAGNASQPSDPIALKTRDPNPSTRTANSMGINISSTSDWSEDRLFANAMQQAREWKKPDGSVPSIDPDGWPLEDAGCVVWQGIANMHGTYKLSFTGSADLFTSYGRASIVNLSYDASQNLTTADLIYHNQDGAGLYLTFTNTQSGMKTIKLMRPLYPGATQSHALATTFTEQTKQAIARFSVIRFMDYTATNNNQQVNWSDRVSPTYCSFSRSAPGYGWQGRGGAWEYAIQLCNETGKDAWICVPIKATDDYVRSLALLWRDGSNGFAGLNANLKLYIEYSNENWNTAGAFQQSIYNREAAIAEVQAGGSPLNYDGSTNTWHWAWRRVGKRIVEISQIFRSVFGDAAMFSRIRPVLEWQQGDGQNTGTQALTFIENYYNNQAGNFVENPHPVNYYLWGGSGSAYYNPENRNAALTIDTIWSSATMEVANWYQPQSKDANLAACFDLRRTAYEGGSSLDRCNCPADQVKMAAVQDPRMQQAIVDHHNAWSNWNGDLLMYFNLSGDFQWSFTQYLFELNTPKYQAIDTLKQSQRAPLTQGTVIPGAIEGNRWSSVSRGWGGTGTGAVRVDPGVWFAYAIRTNESKIYSVTVQYRATAAATLRLYFGPHLLGDVTIANTNGAIQTSPLFRVFLDANQLYAIRVKSQSGTFDCVQINVD